MHRPQLWGLLLLAACEAHISGAPGDHGQIDAGPGVDAGVIDDAAVLGAWSTPVKILQASSTTADEDDVTLSSNALEMIFAIDSGTTAGKDLFYSSRASTSPSAAWSAAVKLVFNSATQSDETPRFSADDKILYFASGRAGNGTLDIYSVTHGAPDAMTWGTPQPVAAVNTTTLLEKWYMPCGNQYVMVQATASNGTDLVTGTAGSATKPTPIAELNSAQNETGTYLSADCLTIYFASSRPAATSPTMIYKSTRSSVMATWQVPSPVLDFAIPGGNGNQEDPWMSPDLRTFVFASNAAGTKDIYISTR